MNNLKIFRSGFGWLFALVVLISCQSKNGKRLVSNSKDMHYYINMYGDTIQKITKNDALWRKELNDLEYLVLREKGTEVAFTGDLLTVKENGLFSCRGCGLPLFASKHKFESGTGWPSFYEVLDSTNIVEDTDYDLGYPRTELTCAKCGGHLGHVFSDGPAPTGLRYCINSVSLDFIKAEN